MWVNTLSDFVYFNNRSNFQYILWNNSKTEVFSFYTEEDDEYFNKIKSYRYLTNSTIRNTAKTNKTRLSNNAFIDDNKHIKLSDEKFVEKDELSKEEAVNWLLYNSDFMADMEDSEGEIIKFVDNYYDSNGPMYIVNGDIEIGGI